MVKTWSPHGPSNWFSLNLDHCAQGCSMPNFLASILTDIFNFLIQALSDIPKMQSCAPGQRPGAQLKIKFSHFSIRKSHNNFRRNNLMSERVVQVCSGQQPPCGVTVSATVRLVLQWRKRRTQPMQTELRMVSGQNQKRKEIS